MIVTRGGEFAVPEISAIVLDHVRGIAAARLGTVTTARETGVDSALDATFFAWSSTIAEISGTANSPPRVTINGS